MPFKLHAKKNDNGKPVCLFTNGLPVFTDYYISHCYVTQVCCFESTKITLLGSNILFSAVEATAFSSKALLPTSYLLTQKVINHKRHVQCQKNSHEPCQALSQTTNIYIFFFASEAKPFLLPHFPVLPRPSSGLTQELQCSSSPTTKPHTFLNRKNY